MKTRHGVQPSTWWLLLGLCVSYGAALYAPVSWGWENGVLENTQVLLLGMGAAVAIYAAVQQRVLACRSLWWVALMFWLCMLGRELAWGAVFLPPVSFSEVSGPRYTSSILPWKFAVKWVCGAMLLLALWWAWRHQLLRQVLLRWQREAAWPWGCLVVFVVAMLLSALAEGRHLPGLPALPASTILAMEEAAECWAYVALCWAQWRLFQHMQAWR